jgi:hypothetical protein
MTWNGVKDTLSWWIALVIPLTISTLLAGSSLVHRKLHIFGHNPQLSWCLIAAAGVLGLVEAVLVVRRQRRLTEFDSWMGRAEAAETAIMAQIREELISLETLANFYSSERISLFRRDDAGFVLIGRRSRNPTYDSSPGRETHPVDQGVIAQAWSHGLAEEPGLPSGGMKPEPLRAWQTAQTKRWGVPEQICAALTMRSEWYLAIRIETRERAHGVLLFESTITPAEASAAGSPTATTRDRYLLAQFAKPAGTRLAALIVATRSVDSRRIRKHMAQENPSRS